MNKKDYFKKRNKLVDRFNKKLISYEEFTSQMSDLAVHFKPEWGNALSERGKNLGDRIMKDAPHVGANNYGVGRVYR